MKVKKSKAKKPSNGVTKVKSIEKPSKNPQWKKIKLSGNLMSDDGGFGLEGLLGLEVLENPAEAVTVTKEKFVKVKRAKAPVKEDNSDESDTEHTKLSKNQRKKKKKLLKKTKAQLKDAANNAPGRFVRPPPNDKNAKNVIKNDGSKKKNKSKKGKKQKQNDDSTSDEPKLAIDDLIVRYSLDQYITFIQVMDSWTS